MWKIKNTTGGPVVVPGKNVILLKQQTLELNDIELSALKTGYPDLMKHFDVFATGEKKEARAMQGAQPKKASKKVKNEMDEAYGIL